MNYFSQAEEIKQDILRLGKPKIITIDGRNGAGKSTLARQFSGSLNIPNIDFDQYLNRNKDAPYWDMINYECLKLSLSNCQNMIISRICMLKVLSVLNIIPDYSIYIDLIEGHSIYSEYTKHIDKAHSQEVPTNSVDRFFPYSATYTALEYDPQEKSYKIDRDVKEYHTGHNPERHCSAVLLRLCGLITPDDTKHINVMNFAKT